MDLFSGVCLIGNTVGNSMAYVSSDKYEGVHLCD